MSQYSNPSVSLALRKSAVVSLLQCAGTAVPLPQAQELSFASMPSSTNGTGGSTRSNIGRDSVTGSSTGGNFPTACSDIAAETLLAEVSNKLSQVRTSADYHQVVINDYEKLYAVEALPVERLASAILEAAERLISDGEPDLASVVAFDGLRMVQHDFGDGTSQRVLAHADSPASSVELEGRLLIALALAGLQALERKDGAEAEAVVFLKEASSLLRDAHPEIVVEGLMRAVNAAQLCGHVDELFAILVLGQEVCAHARLDFFLESFLFTLEKVDVYLGDGRWKAAKSEVGLFTQSLDGGIDDYPASIVVELEARAAAALLGMKRFDEAGRVARSALRRAESKSIEGLCMVNEVLGSVAMREGDFEEAAMRWALALDTERLQKAPDPMSLSRCSFALAHAYASLWDRSSEERVCRELADDLKRMDLWDSSFGLEVLEYQAHMARRDEDETMLVERAKACERHVCDLVFASPVILAHKLFLVSGLFAASDALESPIHAGELINQSLGLLGDRRSAPELTIDLMLARISTAAMREDLDAVRDYARELKAFVFGTTEDPAKVNVAPALAIDVSLALAGTYLDLEWDKDCRAELRRAHEMLRNQDNPSQTSWAGYYFLKGDAVLAMAHNLSAEESKRALKYLKRSHRSHLLARASGEEGLDPLRRADLASQCAVAYGVLWDVTANRAFLDRARNALRFEERVLRRLHRDRGERYDECLETLRELYASDKSAAPDDSADLATYQNRWNRLEAERSRRRQQGSWTDLE